MNNKVLFQCFDRRDTLLKFPYPPIYQEEDTDYVCFSLDKDISSKCWEMIYVDNYDKDTIDAFLDKYKDRREIKTNQIQAGPVFDEEFVAYETLVSVPKLSELPEMHFDSSKMLPTCDENGKYIYKKNPVYTGGKYEGRPLLLTIGVPVSNQIETIDRCLSHIKPLLDELDSELVVVDTGSTDGTIEVCEEYGARVIEFPWCDNMSAARNTALYNAKGLWYMSIDDDEWFDDVDDIIDFFKSGRYKKVQVATYIQRNYMSKKGDSYSDVAALRLAKIVPELHFEGRIHDALVVLDAETVIGDSLASYANHYGFARDDMEKIRKKYKRNVTILLYDIYEYPEGIRYNYQLANELKVIEYYKEAAAYFFRGLAMEKELGVTFYSKHHSAALVSTAYNRNSEETMYLINLLKDEYVFTIAEKAYFAHAMADIGLRNGYPYEKVLENYKQYVKYREMFEKDPKDSMANTYIGLHMCSHKSYINATHAIAFCAYMGLGMEKEALKELNELEDEKIFDIRHPFYVHLYMASGEAFKQRMAKISCVQRESRIPFLLYGFVKYMCKETTESYNLERLVEVMNYFSVDHIRQFFKDNEGTLEEIFWQKVFTTEQIVAIESGTNISLQVKYLYAYMIKRKFVKMEKGMEALDMFLKYVRVTSEFAHAYYNPALFIDEMSNVIPAEYRACSLVWEACNETSLQAMIRKLKSALLLLPEVHHEIGELLKAIGDGTN